MRFALEHSGPHRVVGAQTTTSGIHVLWDGTSFNISNTRLEITDGCAIGLHWPTTSRVHCGTTGWPEYQTVYCRIGARCQIMVTITPPMMWHMESTSSKSATRREWPWKINVCSILSRQWFIHKSSSSQWRARYSESLHSDTWLLFSVTQQTFSEVNWNVDFITGSF